MSQNIVNLLGAGTGVDTKALVASLVAVERSAPQERIDKQRETAETRISDLGLLNSALSSLQDAATALGNADVFNTKSAVIGDSTAFSAVSLGTNAPIGDFSFTIAQLAQAQSLSTQSTFENTTDTVGTGTLTFNFGSYETVVPPANPTTFTENTEKPAQTITIDETNNTLAGLAKTINDADFGVQASLVNDGTGQRLVFRAESGVNNQLQVAVSDSDGDNTDTAGLSRFAFNGDSQQLVQNQIGQDAQFAVNGLAVARSSNTIDDVIDGFEFNLSGLTDVGEAVNVTIERDTSAAVNIVRDFVDIYNTFLETVEPLIGTNPETNERGSLAGDTLARNLPNQVRQLLVGNVGGLDSTFTALTNIGVRTERDGSLSIDEKDFSRAIDNNFEAFTELFIPVTQSSTDQITVNTFGNNTQAGAYDIAITQQPARGNLLGVALGSGILANLSAPVPTSATLTGTAPLALLSDFVASSGRFVGGTSTLPLDLATQGASAGDYDFSISVDGDASAANISLPIADYATNDDVATALQTAINNDASISGVSVSFTEGQFSFTSSTTGAASTVALTAVGANANQLGIDTGSATAGTGGANDYDFNIDVDGTTSGTISVTPGSYASFEDLAAELQTRINADATLTGASASVGVSYNGTQFVVTSATTGTSSTIDNISPIGSEAVDLGINSGTTEQGADSGGNTSAYDFSIALNGTESGVISIDSGDYADFDELAVEIESQINADTALAAVGATVNVSYDSVNNRFNIESSRFGAVSNVVVTNIGADAADLGLAAGTSTVGKNVAGTIDGVAGFGTGNVLLPALGEAGESLALLIGENATTGTINFSRGLGGALEALITQFLGSSGTIALRETSLSSDIEDLDTDQLRLDSRIEAYQELLTSKFIASEAIVRSLQRSGDFLVTTLDNLLNAGRD
jgi:flagellar hook-associated protein 2